jgi:competence protein ComEA
MTSTDPPSRPDRWASWLAATPVELVGLAVLLLGALVATGALWWGALQRPDGLPTDHSGSGDTGIAGTGVGGDGLGSTGQVGVEVTPSDPARDDGWHGGDGRAGDGHAGDGSPPGGRPAAGQPAPTEVVVHVSGAVARPGLVTLPAGARVGDAIEAAGGPVDGADPARLNLARPLEDGEHVHLPREGEELPASWDGRSGDGGGPSAGAGGGDARVDLNRANAAELESLPGIGPARAAAIIDHRERHGPFRVPGDLREVPGIGERTFQQLAELVTVS